MCTSIVHGAPWTIPKILDCLLDMYAGTDAVSQPSLEAYEPLLQQHVSTEHAHLHPCSSAKSRHGQRRHCLCAGSACALELPSRHIWRRPLALTRSRACVATAGASAQTTAGHMHCQPHHGRKRQRLCAASARVLAPALATHLKMLSGPHEVHGRTSGAHQGKFFMQGC